MSTAAARLIVLASLLLCQTSSDAACKGKKKQVPLDGSNLHVSSNSDYTERLVIGELPWSPTDDDPDRTVKITLPSVDGVPPGQYDIMEVKIRPDGPNLVPIAVQILDKNGVVLFEALFSSTSTEDLILEEFTSSSMQILPSTQGTSIVLKFAPPMLGLSMVYKLEVFACVPELQVRLDQDARCVKYLFWARHKHRCRKYKAKFPNWN